MTTHIPDLSTTSTLGRLRQLKETSEPRMNRNDLAVTLIAACIFEGFITRREIIAAMRDLKFDYRHAAIMLDRGNGGLWSRDSAAVYSLKDSV